MSRFLDTNVLLYSIDTSTVNARKRERAAELLEATDNVLSVQVLQEFYVQCTRASRTDTLPHEVAVGLIDAWLRYPIVGSSVDLLRRGLDLRARYTWSYRDAAVVAAALDAGCTELMTEDLNRGLKVDGLTIVDPFVDH